MSKPIVFTSPQIELIDRVGTRLDILTAQAPNEDVNSKNRSDQELQVISLLGGRGSGKSTLMREIIRQSENRSSVNSGGLAVCDTIDCSTQPIDIPPGFTVMVKLLDWAADRCREVPPGGDRIRDLPDEEILVEFAGNLPDFFALGLQTVSGYHEFAHYAKTGVQQRLKLRETVCRALDLLCARLQVRAIAIPLDDFDLVHRDRVLPWLTAFADELNQQRLIFLLTADLYRLERLSYSADTFDEKTGRAILAKFLSMENRFQLPNFERTDRLTFAPLGKDNADATLGCFLEDVLGTLPDTRGLKNTIHALLPHHPRGLENLYCTWQNRKVVPLTSSPPSDENTCSEMETIARADSFEQRELLGRFLQELATARDESLLARRIAEVSVLDWPEELSFEDRAMTPELWIASVELALARACGVSGISDGGGFRIRRSGFPGLATAMDLREITGLYPQADDEDARERVSVNLTAPLNTSGQQGPGWREPILDPLAHRRPLRDAAQSQRAVWAELLLDLGFIHSGWHRAKFMSEWRPLAQRLHRCQFVVGMETLKFEEELEQLDGEMAGNQSHGHWLAIRGGQRYGTVKIAFGWPVMLEALRGNRSTHSRELLRTLQSLSGKEETLLPVNHDGGWESEAGSEHLLSLPARVWSMVLLADSLERWPWQALNRPDFRTQAETRSLARLSSAMIKVSYLHVFYRFCNSKIQNLHTHLGLTEVEKQTAAEISKIIDSVLPSAEDIVGATVAKLDRRQMPNNWYSGWAADWKPDIAAILDFQLESQELERYFPNFYPSYKAFERLQQEQFSGA